MKSNATLITSLVSILILTGCSSNAGAPTQTILANNTSSLVPKCSIVLNSSNSYWSVFKNGKIYLYTKGNQKCLLRIISGKAPNTRSSVHKTQDEAENHRVAALKDGYSTTSTGKSEESGFFRSLFGFFLGDIN